MLLTSHKSVVLYQLSACAPIRQDRMPAGESTECGYMLLRWERHKVGSHFDRPGSQNGSESGRLDVSSLRDLSPGLLAIRTTAIRHSSQN